MPVSKKLDWPRRAFIPLPDKAFGTSPKKISLQKDTEFFPKRRKAFGLQSIHLLSSYLNFKNPSCATDSEMTDVEVIVRYEGDAVMGFTILHARKRLPKFA